MFPVDLLFIGVQDQGDVLEHLEGGAVIDLGLMFGDGDDKEMMVAEDKFKAVVLGVFGGHRIPPGYPYKMG
jgi:hypothetical protein